MPKQDDRKIAADKPAGSTSSPADEPRLVTLAEYWLRPVDQLDYIIRRRVFHVSH